MEAGTQTELEACCEPQQAAETAAAAPPASAAAAVRPATASADATAAAKPQTPAAAARKARPSTACDSTGRRPTPGPHAAVQSSRPASVNGDSSPAPQKLLPARPKTSMMQMLDRTPMALSHNPDPRLRNWQRLEHLRLHSLGLSSKLSRRYNVARARDFQPVGRRFPFEPPAGGVWLPASSQRHHQELQPIVVYSGSERRKNDVAPFKTFQKPTCGVFFARDTDNKKAKHDLQPTDLIKWRYFL